jgi:undecaprenyl-diphosphatase
VTILKAFFLGVIQGLTEFLPVSSSGHLLVAQKWFGLPDPDKMLLFNILLHVATLLAVVLVFRKRIWELVKTPFCKTNLCLLVATAISCVLIFAFHGLVDRVTYGVIPYMFLITAAILIAAHLLSLKVKPLPERDPTYWQAAIVGAVQGLAAFPGISRSGSTITAGLGARMKRESAAEFSFLLSIPIILASLVYELIDGGAAAVSFDFWQAAVGFAAAFACGLVSIKFMLAVVKRIQLYWFAIYLVVLAVLTFAIQ